MSPRPSSKTRESVPFDPTCFSQTNDSMWIARMGSRWSHVHSTKPKQTLQFPETVSPWIFKTGTATCGLRPQPLLSPDTVGFTASLQAAAATEPPPSPRASFRGESVTSVRTHRAEPPSRLYPPAPRGLIKSLRALAPGSKALGQLSGRGEAAGAAAPAASGRKGT